MKLVRYIFPLMLITMSMAGCASDSRVREIKHDAFSKHFRDQGKCKAYIDSLAAPAADKISAKRSPEEMRVWFREHQDEDAFSRLVIAVQRATEVHGELHPRRESDQLKVTMELFEVLKSRPDFELSSCGAGVREFVMESLYLGLGGESSPVVDELRQRGVESSWEQRWVLLTLLMAGAVADSWE